MGENLMYGVISFGWFLLYNFNMELVFAWDEWNRRHIGRHRVSVNEAEYVVRHARAPWPEQKGDDKLVVWGPTEVGRLLQVIFVFKRPDEIEFESLPAEEWENLAEDDEVIYVIHAMELTPSMKRIYRRRNR
jgi:uncharacterized DUF497 family protein